MQAPSVVVAVAVAMERLALWEEALEQEDWEQAVAVTAVALPAETAMAEPGRRGRAPEEQEVMHRLVQAELRGVRRQAQLDWHLAPAQVRLVPGKLQMAELFN